MASGLCLLKSTFPLGKNPMSKPFLYLVSPTVLFYRNTIILKRRVPLPPMDKYKNEESVRRNLDKLHQEYELVENTNLKPKPKIDLILTQYIEDIGKPGQIVAIQPILAYDLVILGQAMYATPENLAKIHLISDSEVDKHSSLTAFKTLKILKKKTLSVFMNMHEPWTIEQWHIRVTFRLNGVHILSDDCIELPENSINGPNLNLEGKDFAVHVTINNCEKVAVRCRLHHYTMIHSKRIILPPDHECIPSEPIFPEQADLLNSIPLPEYVQKLNLA